MGIAGIWIGWKTPANGEILLSLSMLDAYNHEFIRNYHKPQDEKRMVAILQDEDYDALLAASPEQSYQYVCQYPANNLATS